MRVFHRGKRGAGKWWLDFSDGDGNRRRMPGFSNKRLTEDLQRKVESLMGCRAAGVAPGYELSKWIEELPNVVRDRLVRYGLVDSKRAAASKPLRDHLGDFRQTILARGGTAKHADHTYKRALAVVDGCGFRLWGDISGHRVMVYLKVRRDAGMGATTSNNYLRAIKSFCRWMVEERRAGESPLAYLKAMNTAADRRRERRALTAEEIGKLLAATAAGPKRSRMTGRERALGYRTVLETGLRLSEVRSLTRECFDLRSDPPTVTVAAGYSKHRRQDVLPLRPDLAAALRVHVVSKVSGELVFPFPRRAAALLRKDLAAAKVPKSTPAGIIDFHALRHTFVTMLVEAGVHPKIAQKLARHSTSALTMDVYAHVTEGQEVEALGRLPKLSAAYMECYPGSGQKASGSGRA